MKVIGIDIDDTIVKTWDEQIFLNYNKKYNACFSFQDLKDHNFNGDIKLKNEFFDFFYTHHSSLKMFDQVKQTLEQIQEEYGVYFITSRPEKDKEITREYLDANIGLNLYEDLLFTCDKEDKKCHIASRLLCDVVIDDAAHHIENYINNTSIERIIIYNQPWNTHIKEDNLRVFRVSSWNEILNILS